jgi:hypothetical protein
MGEKARETLRLQFGKRLRLDFHGARITSNAGLLACLRTRWGAGTDGDTASSG